jgi:hypothetical protein
VDLRDLWRGGLSWRRCLVLVQNLPPESATAQDATGEPARWGTTDWLLADIFDVLAAANWQRVGDKNRSRPKPYPRPRSKQAVAALGQRLKQLKAKGAT